jgi:CubicO group peptidase (beta-lactamase class C family)
MSVRTRYFTRRLILAAIVAMQAAVLHAAPPVAAENSADARRSAVEASILSGMEKFQVPGASIAIIDNYAVLWSAGYGDAIAGGDRKVTPETLFQAASISKPITALATLKLVEKGELDLDGAVNEQLKGWQIPAGSVTTRLPIRVRDLLSHHSGLAVHGFIGYAKSEPRPTLLQVLNGEQPANSPPVQPFLRPGYKFSYSGGGYCVLQQLLIETSGQAFPDFMRQNVLGPLKMAHSTFDQPLPESRAGEAAAGHRIKRKVIEGDCHIYPEMAAAGLWTTPSDLSLAGIDIAKSYAGHEGTLLSQATTRQMLTRENASFGLGLVVQGEGERLAFSHGGGNEGFRCQLVAFPATGQGLVIMTNSDTGGGMLGHVIKAASEAYDWPKEQDEEPPK